MAELHDLTAVEQAEGIRTGELSPWNSPSTT